MKKAVITVLASGGLDSTTCLSYYLAENYSVHALWIDYGQLSAQAEEAAIERISMYYGVLLQKVRVEGIHWPNLDHELFEFRGRNLTLVSLALNTAAIVPSLIALGIHRGTPFADCTDAFTQQLNSLLILLTDGGSRLDCPFLQWSKLDVAEYAISNAVPMDLTYSCEKGLIPPCKECVKCRDNQAIFSTLQNRSVIDDNGPCE